MKSNELRIGNWVYDKKFKGNIEFKSFFGLCNIENNPDAFEPIPLTEEWLLRFGFYKPAYSWIGDKFHLSEWDDYPLNWCVAFNKNNAILVDKLKYVHQLQNLYFALTGQELEIKTT